MKKLLYLFLGLLFISQHIVAQVPSYVPTDGLVGYWPFNGNANDETGNGNNGTVNGATLISDRFGKENSSYSFDGVDDYIELSDSFFEGSTSVGSFTFYTSVKVNSYEPGNIFNKEGYWRTIGLSNTQVNGKNVFYFGGSQPSPQQYFSIYSDSEFELNKWYNLMIIFNDGELKMFINGELDNSKTISLNTLDWSFLTAGNSTSTNHFGRGLPINGNHLYFNGEIDDFIYWERVLTEQEVANLYASNSSNECSTLVINTGALSTNPVTYNSTVNIYPNPANDQITIDCGNLDNVEGWNIKITNMLGQEVFSQPMNTQQYVIPLHTWTGQGMYFVKIINAQNEVVNMKKIVLQ